MSPRNKPYFNNIPTFPIKTEPKPEKKLAIDFNTKYRRRMDLIDYEPVFYYNEQRFIPPRPPTTLELLDQSNQKVKQLEKQIQAKDIELQKVKTELIFANKELDKIGQSTICSFAQRFNLLEID